MEFSSAILVLVDAFGRGLVDEELLLEGFLEDEGDFFEDNSPEDFFIAPVLRPDLGRLVLDSSDPAGTTVSLVEVFISDDSWGSGASEFSNLLLRGMMNKPLPFYCLLEIFYLSLHLYRSCYIREQLLIH